VARHGFRIFDYGPTTADDDESRGSKSGETRQKVWRGRPMRARARPTGGHPHRSDPVQGGQLPTPRPSNTERRFTEEIMRFAAANGDAIVADIMPMPTIDGTAAPDAWHRVPQQSLLKPADVLVEPSAALRQSSLRQITVDDDRKHGDSGMIVMTAAPRRPGASCRMYFVPASASGVCTKRSSASRASVGIQW
jgi:hypothetical protein